MKSHTGSIFTMGKGAIVSDSTKQKVNSRSSTEAELNAIDDEIPKVVWSKRFMEAQGYPVECLIIYQDNTSTIRMAVNGKASSGKRTRHFDIKLFYVADLAQRKLLSVEYCPTDAMLGDYNTKPTLGSKFKFLRDLIMNFTNRVHKFAKQLFNRSVLDYRNSTYVQMYQEEREIVRPR